MKYPVFKSFSYFFLFILTLGLTTIASTSSAQEAGNIYLEPSEFTEKGATAWREGVIVSNYIFKTMDNKRVKLYDLLEKPLLIEFWNPESTISQKHQANLKEYYKDYEVNILSICSDKFEADLENLVSKENLPWRVVCDNYHRYNGKSFTATHKVENAGYVLITPDRRVRIIANSTNIGGVEKAIVQFAKKQ